MIYGLKQTSINLNMVNAISGETGLLFGKIKIEDGAKQRQITNVWKKTVTRFTNKARDAIEALNQPQQHQLISDDDVVSKLERLASLKEKGILTQQEFDAQKAKLLEG